VWGAVHRPRRERKAGGRLGLAEECSKGTTTFQSPRGYLVTGVSQGRALPGDRWRKGRRYRGCVDRVGQKKGRVSGQTEKSKSDIMGKNMGGKSVSDEGKHQRSARQNWEKEKQDERRLSGRDSGEISTILTMPLANFIAKQHIQKDTGDAALGG